MTYLVIHLLCAILTVIIWGFAVARYGDMYTIQDLRRLATIALVAGPIALIVMLFNIDEY